MLEGGSFCHKRYAPTSIEYLIPCSSRSLKSAEASRNRVVAPREGATAAKLVDVVQLFSTAVAVDVGQASTANTRAVVWI